MGMFDYCNLTLHDEHGNIILHKRGQVSIEKMLCTYNITEHGFFIKYLRRFRNKTIYLTATLENEFFDNSTICNDMWISFNWFGVITKIEYKIYQLGHRDKANYSVINIRPELVNKWSIDNIKSDLMLNPQLFKKDISYFRRAISYLRFNYYEIKDAITAHFVRGRK